MHSPKVSVDSLCRGPGLSLVVSVLTALPPRPTDAENDVVFNIASLIFPAVGSLLHMPIFDPLGGVLLSLHIIREWLETLAETVARLSGAVCGSQEIARALYLVTRFKSVYSVGQFEVYWSGDESIVEADIILPYDLPLKEAHDIGEIVSYCLESTSGVARAYVHLDYHLVAQPPGHLTQRG